MKFLFMMICPALIFVYTLSFMKWMVVNKHLAAAISAGVLAVLSFCVTGISLWRLAT